MASNLVPVTVLTGFLGSGKTTLLNNILKSKEHKMKFAVIENEFGEIGIDEKLLANNAKEDTGEEIVEVMNGCICCTVRGDLVEALKRLHKRLTEFDGVLIETTGMADPAPVAQTFFVDEDIKAMYKLDGIVTVVDAKHIVERLDEEKPEGVENESVEQIAFADRIILNKTDLMVESTDNKQVNGEECLPVGQIGIHSAGQVLNKRVVKVDAIADAKLKVIEGRIREHNPEAKIVRAQFSDVHPKELLNLGGFNLKRVLEMEPDFLKAGDDDHQHDDSVSSCSWSMPNFELNVRRLEMWIDRLLQANGADLYRYKGVLAVKGCDAKFIFQGVGMLFSGGFADEMGCEDQKGAFWQPGETRESRFVFIGKKMKDMKEQLLQAFKACEAENELRFKVGDKVECRTSMGWSPATVKRTWMRGHPYQLQLDKRELDNDPQLVYGPCDWDMFVRPRQ